ncbi:MAG: helix-hairpin-helix domain-containing protein, partial [Methylobacter sp.]
VKYREEKGLFKAAEDLVNVDGIGGKTVEKLKHDVLLSDAVAAQNTDKKADIKAVEPVTDKKTEEKAK